MIILVTGVFDICDKHGVKTGRQEFVVSHGIDSLTYQNVVVPNVHPTELGGHFDTTIMEWVLED